MQPFLQWKIRKYYTSWACVCLLSYPACNDHVLYYIVTCDLSGCTVFFPHCLINGTILIINVIKQKICTLIFSANFCETFLMLRTNDWDIVTNVHKSSFNPLNPELNPICYLLALLGAHHFLHISRIRVKLLTFRLLMLYIHGAPILDVSRSHTTTQHSR